MNCQQCGTPLRPGAKFCPSCGAPAPAAAPAAIPQANRPAGGFTVAAPRPAAAPGVTGGAPPARPGTVIKEEVKRPGTILIGQKQDAPVCGWLVIMRGRRKGHDFRIEKDSGVLGRAGKSDYVIEDDTVSSEHARIKLEDGVYVVYDLGSANGTYVNGERVHRAELTDGDVFKVGETLVLFKEAKPRIPLDQADVPISSLVKPKSEES
ncbi:FHA domain-containing protein [Candidatus Neomicrothrix sp.]|uniref:FHA domain-containing protein n=1 Tax=Candidatus Neomicrothrix sp. TaxID=2719034 RepID=UPI002597B2A6|nr:FHA domain-containing protein [Candidatus Microthrix sp.]HMS49703.1 FHA domain-containing protein [Candidatus Microthrix sp.]